MRRVAEREDIDRFIIALARRGANPTRLYFTGGATGVLLGWRTSTIDVDIHLVPDDDRLLRALPELKESLQLNVELACPAHFIPELPGWQERSLFITQEGSIGFYHYDLYAQALAKIERGHALDRTDVEQMFSRGLIEASKLKQFFEAIEPQLYRYPAIDPPAFRRAVESTIEKVERS
ncbi:MAG: hypothetical protein EXR70_18080 [Deltaproteobacteria bacterium]|nr:hypothetical protein [Deltaproteobacteria bacterium]